MADGETVAVLSSSEGEMSAQDNSGAGSEKNLAQIVQKTAGTTSFPIDLAATSTKIAHVKPTDTVKVASVVQATPSQATTFRTIGGGQSPQVRVVMPPGATLMPQAMIKQIEGTGGVRTQITAIPARTISQTSITVARPVTPTTYLPRAGVTATNIQAQRLGTPVRTPTPPTVTGLPTNFVRGPTVARNSSSPATTVISPTTATWMTTGSGQVQLIRAINQQPRQRLIAQNIASSTGNTSVVAVGQATNLATVQAQQQQNQGRPHNKFNSGQYIETPNQHLANIQSVATQPTQQTFVATLATVLPPRQQTATLVYSNVANSQGQAQQFNPVSSAQRFTVAASLAGGQRQMRPIQLGNRISTAKIGVGGMNTTSISIRTPNIPVLTPSLPAGGTAGTIQARNTSGNVNLSTTSLSNTRIIQLQQQQPGTGATQLIGSTGRIANNLMLQPIIMNATAGTKIGIRPPTTIGTKVQPSLTITQLGVSKISAAQQQQSASQALASANLQGATITPSTNSNVVAANIVHQSQQQHTAQQTVSVNVSNAGQPITQIVSVNQSGTATGQIITAQNVNVNVPSSATVVPLAITSRSTNVLTGTITPIKSAPSVSSTISVPPIAKVIPQQQHIQQQQQQQVTQIQQNTQQGNQLIPEIITSSQQQHQGASVFIHTRPSSSGNAVNSATATVIPNSGTFLPAGGTYYYESVPASGSTGVLSLTTTTVTSSISNTQTVTSSNIATGLVTSIPYTPSPGTFAVVPSSNRTISQIHIPVSSSSGGPPQNISQIQAVPVRFAQQHVQEQQPSGTNQTGIAQHQPQAHTQHHQIITMTQSQQPQQQSQQNIQQTHMLIPLQTSIKLPATASMPASSPRGATNVNPPTISSISAAFLRKRENDGSPVRAAKNLGPTLLSMGTSSQMTNVITEQQRIIIPERPLSPESRPGSSGGSTTVSANSSPGVDQQMREELNLQPMNRMSNESHFNPIDDLYSNHQNVSAPSYVRAIPPPQLQHPPVSINNSNGNLDSTPRKKIKRPASDHQPSPSLAQHQQQHTAQTQHLPQISQTTATNSQEGTPKVNNNLITNNNKENTKPTEIIIKKPRPCNLLDSYKQNWKATNNHFQRYSDVKPREERRQTVIDLANQAHVAQKINGWKVFHLDAQMEDLCELETQVYDKLSSMLQQLETNDHQTPDTDRVNDLIKGNMQRSKIIVDGVNEARTQIMKIFEHKSHVADIIVRCASKRNFKKREKT